MKKIKRYAIEQFPKNKLLIGFSPIQLEIRKYQKLKLVKSKICNQCWNLLPLSEFYTKKRKDNSIYYDCKCRDCRIKNQGAIEIGKHRFAKKIFSKGFRRCSICKEIKPLSDFSKCVNKFGNYSSNCYECNKKKLDKYRESWKNNISDFYVKQYAKRHKIKIDDKNSIDSLRDEIKNKNKPKYFLDGLEFVTKESFSDYIYEKYKISKDATLKRLQKGYKESECIIPEKELRILKNGSNKGMIKVIDTVTKEEFIFRNTRDEKLLKMFSCFTINKGIKTGLPVGGKRSKYKNPCIIKRLKNEK